MNTLQKQKNGFTLIEMMVTVVIVGVLAAIAVPSMWSQMDRQKGQEALNAMNLMRNAIESCALSNGGNYTTCKAWDAMNMSDPSSVTSNMFSYQWSGTGVGAYVLTATKPGSGTITLTRNAATGVVTCAGTSHFQGMC